MKSNVPKLRFNGFSDEWELSNLKKCANGFDYGMNSAAIDFDGENKYIRITDIDESNNKYINTKLVSPDGKLEDKYLVRNSDILLARTGASTGKAYLYNEKDGKLYFAGFLIRINVNKDNSPRFIFANLLTIEYSKWIKVMSMRSGQPGINSQEYAQYEFYKPKLEEQEKIAGFLTKVDNYIEKQEDKVKNLESYKKGMMQKIFSQEIRFKDEEGIDYPEWEEKKLGDIATKIMKKNKGFEIKNIISNSAKNGLVSQRDFFTKDIANKNNIDGYYVIELGDFVYNPRKSKEAPYGPVNIFKLSEKGVVSPLYFCFRINKCISKVYMEYYFNSTLWHRYIHMNSDQGVRHDRVSIKDTEIMRINIKLPDEKEQTKIASFLSNIDAIVEKEKQKLENLKTWKKGLLQQMFV